MNDVSKTSGFPDISPWWVLAVIIFWIYALLMTFLRGGSTSEKPKKKSDHTKFSARVRYKGDDDSRRRDRLDS